MEPGAGNDFNVLRAQKLHMNITESEFRCEVRSRTEFIVLKFATPLKYWVEWYLRVFKWFVRWNLNFLNFYCLRVNVFAYFDSEFQNERSTSKWHLTRAFKAHKPSSRDSLDMFVRRNPRVSFNVLCTINRRRKLLEHCASTENVMESALPAVKLGPWRLLLDIDSFSRVFYTVRKNEMYAQAGKNFPLCSLWRFTKCFCFLFIAIARGISCNYAIY